MKYVVNNKKGILISLENEYLDELEELVNNIGIEVVERVVQFRKKPDSKYYVGKGKIEEILKIIEENEIDFAIFDDEIRTIQRKNIKNILGITILDRTDVILNIFSENAKTKESKLQIELAKLKYKLPEIVGLGKAMSRLGGGIGTRGPGEKEKEYKKRAILDKIKKIENELDKIKRTRGEQSKNRKRHKAKQVILVGYTNAGKSTLMNNLTGADVISEDRLFVTLDTKMKKIYALRESNIVLGDTVGFIRKLPHVLVASFKSTLEVVKEADILLKIIDISKENFEEDIKVIDDVLEEIGDSGIKNIYVFNKVDLYANYKNEIKKLEEKYKNVAFISAQNSINIEELLEKLVTKL